MHRHNITIRVVQNLLLLNVVSPQTFVSNIELVCVA